MRFFRSSLTKKILGAVVILIGSGVFLNGYVGMGEAVHAQAQNGGTEAAETTGKTIDTMSMREILNMVLKIIYLVLRPLLVIAGLALDNTLVYASVFHMDAPLWKFRNMMKNFANFALGFMVLFAIIKSLLTGSGEGSIKDDKSPLGIIKKTLIAGVLIQASWFLVAAAVDISTVATYAVGGLPLSVLKNTDIDHKILSVNSTIDLNKFDIMSPGGEDFKVWYSTKYTKAKGDDKTIHMSPCRIEKKYIIGREYGDEKYRNIEKFEETPYAGYEVCVMFGSQLVMWKEDVFFNAFKDSADFPTNTATVDWKHKGGYKTMMDTLMSTTGWDTKAYVKDNLVYLGSGDAVLKTGNNFFADSDSLTISSIVQKSKGFVGPLVTMYASLLNFSQLSNASVSSISGTSGTFIIKTLVAVALFFPLLALAVVLILRIGMLRLYIVASPFIIIKESFKIKMDSFEKYLSIKSMIGIIFAPVVSVAALSLSLIFMTALISGFTASNSKDAIHNTLGTQSLVASKDGNDAIGFQGIAELEFSKLDWGEAMDRFSRLMINFFAIGLMWMIFFAAIKANELGKEFGGKIESFGANVFKTLPIIPIGPSGAGVGLGSAYNVLERAPDTYFSNLKTAQESRVREFIDDKKEGGKSTDKNTLTDTQVTDILGKIRGSGNTQEATQNSNQYLTQQGFSGDISNIGTANIAKFYSQLNTDAYNADRANILSKLPSELKTEYATLARNDVQTNVISTNITDTTPVGPLPSVINLNTAPNKKYLDNLFTASGTTSEEITIGTKKVKITKSGTTYTGTVEDVPVTPAPVN